MKNDSGQVRVQPKSAKTGETSTPAGVKQSILKKCPICSSMVADLDKHMRKARHDPNGAAALKPRPAPPRVPVPRDVAGLVCPFCMSSWSNAWQLKSHVAGIHGKAACAALSFEP